MIRCHRTMLDRGRGLSIVRSIVVLTCLFLPVAALAQGAPKAGEPKTIDDCERISEALAYNACLAQFGPARGASPKTFAEPAADGDTGNPDGDGQGKAATGKGGRSASLSGASSFPGQITRDRHGRMSATIDVSSFSGGRSYRQSSSKYRHHRSYARRHRSHR